VDRPSENEQSGALVRFLAKVIVGEKAEQYARSAGELMEGSAYQLERYVFQQVDGGKGKVSAWMHAVACWG